MGKKYSVLLLVLTVFVLLSGVYIMNGTQAYTRYQQNSIAMQEQCGGEAPAHICVQTPRAVFGAFYRSYLDTKYPLFHITYSSSTPLTLLLSVSIPGFSQVQTQTVDAVALVQSRTFIPPILDESLRNLTANDNASINVRVTDRRQHLYYEDTAPVLLYSRWLMQWVTANRLKIAAWVTPDDPQIGTLAAKAEAYLKDQSFPAPAGMVGYKSATPRQVIDQVDAIYDALRLDYHLRYVPVANSLSAFDGATQLVKLPFEVLQKHRGMCIELTALLAAAVEHIGLHSEIIISSDHAFLGVADTQDNKNFEYWDVITVNNNIAADSANVQADSMYKQYEQQHKIMDTILVSDARDAHIAPMV